MEDRDWVVSLIRCADKSLYCGITNNLKQRMTEHDAGKGAKYTRSLRPVELVAASSKMSKSDALKMGIFYGVLWYFNIWELWQEHQLFAVFGVRKKEYGVNRDFIIMGIHAGKLEYREGAIWGNPYLRLLRSQLEKYPLRSLLVTIPDVRHTL